MQEKGPGLTARWAAMMRGMHLELDSDPKILVDTFGKAFANLPKDDLFGINDPQWSEVGRARIRATILWRSRVTEDHLVDSVAHGVRQYVILGAGLDSFAYRRPSSQKEVSVFEIDHPVAQQWKQRRLHEQHVTIPDNVHYVPVNFEEDGLVEILRASPFDPSQPTFFSWIGVNYFLGQSDVQKTLAAILSAVDGYCELSQDFVVPAAFLPNDAAKKALEGARELMAGIGAPWFSLYSPDELARLLKEIGFDHTRHISPQEGGQQYFDGRTDNLKPGAFTHMMIASRGSIR